MPRGFDHSAAAVTSLVRRSSGTGSSTVASLKPNDAPHGCAPVRLVLVDRPGDRSRCARGVVEEAAAGRCRAASADRAARSSDAYDASVAVPPCTARLESCRSGGTRPASPRGRASVSTSPNQSGIWLQSNDAFSVPYRSNAAAVALVAIAGVRASALNVQASRSRDYVGAARAVGPERRSLVAHETAHRRRGHSRAGAEHDLVRRDLAGRCAAGAGDCADAARRRRRGPGTRSNRKACASAALLNA